jgi:hypothetical protein
MDGIAIGARAIGNPVDALATARGPYGPSEGWRPPQDDIVVIYPALRSSALRSPSL